MTIQQIEILIQESGLSPEELAKYLDVSNMTIRRWLKEPRSGQLSRLYTMAFEQAVYALLIAERLTTDSSSVKFVLENGTSLAVKAALKGLGIAESSLSERQPHAAQVILGLNQIGMDEQSRRFVHANEKRLFAYGKLGKEWQESIKTLWKAASSKKLDRLDRFAAYGALFYLLSPFDLIPDHIPVFGLVDDFGILELVANYYALKFSPSDAHN